MFVGIVKLALYLPGCRSLKEKRQVVRRIKDRVRSKCEVFIAETGYQDLWQRAEVGFAVAGSDKRNLEGIMEKTCLVIGSNVDVEVLERYSEIITV